MRNTCASFCALACFLAVGVQCILTDYVDTRIGTGGFGYGIGEMPVGPQVPFGVMRLGPDTSLGLEPFDPMFLTVGGYYFHDPYIQCFSHTHMVGAGEPDLENFGVMISRSLSQKTITNAGYRTRFTHDGEVAKPGLYEVNLPEVRTHVELTVSGTHSGIHRYTCSGSDTCYLLFDVCHAASKDVIAPMFEACKYAEIVHLNTANSGSGEVSFDVKIQHKGRLSGRGAQGIVMYFHAHINASDSAPLRAVSWENRTLRKDVFQGGTQSGSLGIVITPKELNQTKGIVYTVRIGLSFISNTFAKQNLLDTQVDSQGHFFSFEVLRDATQKKWEERLKTVSINVNDYSKSDVTTFYSALYRTFLAPAVYSEQNSYFGEDLKIHSLPPNVKQYMSDLSLWDVYRTQLPLLALLAPDVSSSVVNSMLIMFQEDGGNLPVWVLANVETHCMVGRHSAVVIADAIMKQVQGVNTTACLEAVVAGLQSQNAELYPLGYVPMEKHMEGASLTLDYAIDAGAAWHLAMFLNRSDKAKEMYPYATSFCNVWDTSHSSMCPRTSDGSFHCPLLYLPYPIEFRYTEGNAAQYRWYVPHNISGLLSLFPSMEYAAQELYDLFFLSLLMPLNTSLPNFAYWAGNEPDLLAPFIFNFIGNRYAYWTQYWVGEILPRFFFPYPAGIPGNDDYGAMSAWCVFAYLGLYPVASTDLYAFFVPKFDLVYVQLLPDGAAFSPWYLNASNIEPETTYPILKLVAHGRPQKGKKVSLQYVKINGNALSTPIARHRDLLPRGTSSNATVIEFYLVDEPTVYGQAPPSKGGPSPWYPQWRSSEMNAATIKEMSKLSMKAATRSARFQQRPPQ